MPDTKGEATINAERLLEVFGNIFGLVVLVSVMLGASLASAGYLFHTYVISDTQQQFCNLRRYDLRETTELIAEYQSNVLNLRDFLEQRSKSDKLQAEMVQSTAIKRAITVKQGENEAAGLPDNTVISFTEQDLKEILTSLPAMNFPDYELNRISDALLLRFLKLTDACRT